MKSLQSYNGCRFASTCIKIIIGVLLLMFLIDRGLDEWMHCGSDSKHDFSVINSIAKIISAFKPFCLRSFSSLNLFLVSFSSSLEEPGEMGKPVVFPKDKELEMKSLYKINQFNLMASDMISHNRSLPDYRLAGCSRSFPDDLPDTSIIIAFHNEAWSTLIRTIWSVINRSPRGLVREIILVDDASNKDFLGEKLENYVSTLPLSVYVVRMGNRSGVVRARLKGASLAIAKVLVFLDSHCECTIGWLEPLLFEIHQDRKRIVSPVIDSIDADTFEYHVISNDNWGGFSWRLHFNWYFQPKRELDRRLSDKSRPIRTPTIAGGLFAVDKDYFNEVGSYDSGMIVWGGENLEISFRVWQCGGEILIVTCSHVGHVFRKKSPHEWPASTGHVFIHNILRLAEVWMGRHKEFVYKLYPTAKRTNYGNITDRLRLRDSLKCRSFLWYLDNIFPESIIPARYISLGFVMNVGTRLCFDGAHSKAGDGVRLQQCHNMGRSQVFVFTARRELKIDNLCLDRSLLGYVVLEECSRVWRSSQRWHFNKETSELQHLESRTCLESAGERGRNNLILASCKDLLEQKWILQDFNQEIYSQL